MKSNVKWLWLAALLLLPLAGHAEERKKTSATAPVVTSIEKIQSMLEYHQKMVGMIQSYMKDRTQIPADYRTVSDNEFLKRARAEKMVLPKKEGAPAAATSAPAKPAKNTSPTRY